MPPRDESAFERGQPVRRGSERRLRIAFVYDALFPFQKGGAERRFHELARRLAKRHEVHYVTWRHWDGPALAVADGIVLHGIGRPRAMYGSDGKRRVAEAAAFSAALGPALARRRFDVVDCSATPYLPLYPCWAALRATRTPMLATWHEFWGRHWNEYLAHRPAVARVARLLEERSARFGDAIVAVSRFTAARLPRRADYVVENGIDFREVGPWLPPAQRNGADIVAVGRLIDEKRVDILLDAVAMLRSQLPGIRCEVIGDGPERAALEAQVARLGLGEQVRFLGHVDEATLYDRLSRARTLALTSVREGFGIVVVEAMARGTVPVVARARYSAAATLIEDGATGLVANAEPAAFAAALAKLLKDGALLTAMSAAGVSDARRYDWDELAPRMEAIYGELAGRGRSRVAAGGAPQAEATMEAIG